ncbi:hypothetical protein HK097_004931, partial [Rhizophlyctis rosea]
MFKTDFQGGPAFEIFSSQGSGTPILNWKLTSKSFIKRVYEKDLKGFCYHCEKLGKFSLPKDDKQSVYLIQPYLVFQIFLPAREHLSIELCISDLNHNHRRFFASTASKDVKITALHVTLPLTVVKRGVWLNLCFDLSSLVSDTFRGQSFRCLTNVHLAGTFRLRKIFTLRNRPPDTTGDDLGETAYGYVESLPRTLQFPQGLEYLTQVINVARIGGVQEDSNQ